MGLLRFASILGKEEGVRGDVVGGGGKGGRIDGGGGYGGRADRGEGRIGG